MLEAFITVLFSSPLPVALVILGVLCVATSIVGKIPPINLENSRAFFLGAFGIVLILSANISAYFLANVAVQAKETPQIVATTKVIEILVTKIVPATQAPTDEQVEVFANQGWQNTGIAVSFGDIVTIEYVSGTWTGGIGVSTWYDGEGDLITEYKCAEKAANPSTCKEPMPNVYNGALIGKVGDNLFEIGNYTQFTSDLSDSLFLRMNDHDVGLYDNDGFLTIRVRVQR